MKLRQVLAVAMVLVMLLSSLLVMSIPTAKAATPSVISVSPPDDATDVKLLTEVQMAFNVPMNETSLRPAFALDKGGQPVDGTLYIGTTVDGLGYLDFAPSEALQPGTEYTVTVRANATDMQGNAMGEAFTSVFTTEGGQNNTTSQLQIISPNGLEDWKWWNTQEIKWSSSGIGDLVHLSVVSANHSTTIWDIGDVPNTGSYSFYLDQNLQTAYGGGLLSDNGIVARVTSLDGSVEDFSDRPFFASYDGMDQGSANAIQFVTPTYVPYNPLDPVNLIPASDAAIGYYAPRSKCRIAWVTSEEVGSPLQLSLMHKNADGTAELVQLISDSVPSSNTADYNEFTFTMPYVVADWQTSSKDYCLELREASSGQVEYSHWFGLGPVAALLSVTSPNGGERWEVGKQYDIQWNYDVGGQNPNPWFYVQVLRASDLSVVQDMCKEQTPTHGLSLRTLLLEITWSK